MPGPNTSGTPNTQDYNLGRGVLYFASLDSNGFPTAFRDLGNAPEFNITVSSEDLEHRSSREGKRKIDKTVVLSTDIEGSFQLDELNHENIAAVLSGEKASHTNVSVAGFSEFTMVPSTSFAIGRWFNIENDSHERAYNVQNSDLTVKTTNASPVTLTEGTDFDLDSEFGRIFIKDTTETQTAVSNSEGLDVTLAGNAQANDVNEVNALTKSSVEGALVFISENPANADHSEEYTLYKVKLQADGDISLISDQEFATLPFSFKAESNTAYSDNRTMTVRDVAA